MLQGKIRTGQLDREIIFLKEVTTRGGTNQDKVTSWIRIVSSYRVFSKKIEMPGSEVLIGDQLKYSQKTIFTIRYRTDLNVKMRIALDGNVYEIVSITESGEQRKTFLDIVTFIIDNVSYTYT